jgi:hypothetical protein
MTVVSPELALVDPCLRSDAIASLPPLEPFDFLRFQRAPRRARALDEFWFVTEHEEAEPARWRPPLVVAASVYAASALARVVVMDGLFVLALAAAVVALNALG